MNKTFLSMQTNVANEVQDSSTSLKSIIKEYLNNRYFQVLRSINWECVYPDYTFTTTAGKQDYALPDDFHKEVVVRDTTNGIELGKCDIQRIGMDFPDDADDSGLVSRYSILEDTVQDQPSSASVLACVSSSASDTGVSLLVRGISGGVEVNETVNLNGLTPVNTTNSYTRVKAISKSAVSVGKVTVTSNSAAVTITVMPAKMTTAYCKKMRLFYIPTTAVVIACPYIVKPFPMLEDYDYPLLDISDLLELGAKADVLRYKRQFQKASVFEASFTSALADYIWDKENKSNEVVQFTPTTYNKDNLY